MSHDHDSITKVAHTMKIFSQYTKITEVMLYCTKINSYKITSRYALCTNKGHTWRICATDCVTNFVICDVACIDSSRSFQRSSMRPKRLVCVLALRLGCIDNLVLRWLSENNFGRIRMQVRTLFLRFLILWDEYEYGMVEVVVVKQHFPVRLAENNILVSYVFTS